MVDSHEKLDKGVFLNYPKLMSGDKDLEKLVQEVGKRIGGFRHKEKEIAYSLIVSKLVSEQPIYLTVINAAITASISFMSLFVSLSNKIDASNVALIIAILSLGMICLNFIFSIKYSRDMYVNHAVYEILSKMPVE